MLLLLLVLLQCTSRQAPALFLPDFQSVSCQALDDHRSTSEPGDWGSFLTFISSEVVSGVERFIGAISTCIISVVPSSPGFVLQVPWLSLLLNSSLLDPSEISHSSGSFLKVQRGLSLRADIVELHFLDRSNGASYSGSCLILVTKSRGVSHGTPHPWCPLPESLTSIEGTGRVWGVSDETGRLLLWLEHTGTKKTRSTPGGGRWSIVSFHNPSDGPEPVETSGLTGSSTGSAG